MDDFNAKKSRASKMRQDKYRDRPKKHVDTSSKGAKGDSKDVKTHTQSKPVQDKDESQAQTSETTDHVEEDTRTFSKRKLLSNWDRYEEPLDTSRFEEEVDVIGAHFEELLSMPISGGHLKLKHEHEWEKEKSELQMPWFQLDIQGVEQNLSTILFTERQNLPLDIFSENQLQRMMVRAKRNATSLAEVNASILKVQNLQMQNTSSSQSDVEMKSTKDRTMLDMKCLLLDHEPSEVKESNISENEDLDDILALHESSSKVNSTIASNPPVDQAVKETPRSPRITNEVSPSRQPESTVSTTNTDQPTVSLDDWLDSILDD